MGERNESFGMGVVLPGDQMHCAHRSLIKVQVTKRRFLAGIRPFPAGVDFVVDNPMMNPSGTSRRSGVTPRQKLDARSVGRVALFAAHIRHGEMAKGLR